MTSKELIIMLSILLSMLATRTFAYDIAAENADGVTIYYKYINEGKELEVTRKLDYDRSHNYDYIGNVVIPEEITTMNKTRKVTSIGQKALYNCINLTSVVIPSSVTKIGYLAFSGCKGLSSITIPSGVESIGSDAFTDCSGLTSFSVNEANTTYKSVNGTLMSKDGKILVCYPPCKTETTFNIPNTVTTIGRSAFYRSKLVSITIGNSVKTIEDSAFGRCTHLSSVSVGDSVIIIGHSAFYDCSSLTSVMIPNRVTNIGMYAFYGCKGLTSITIPNSVRIIEEYAFYN